MVSLEGICSCSVWVWDDMSEVDWSTLFESFYEKVRVKIFFRDPSRIPHERLFEMEKKPFLISLEVEDETKGQGSGDMDDGKDD